MLQTIHMHYLNLISLLCKSINIAYIHFIQKCNLIFKVYRAKSEMADQQPESIMLSIKLHYISVLVYISGQLAVLDQQADQS